MTEAEVRSRLVLFAAAEDEPALTSDELDILVRMARKIDSSGIPPSDSSWMESYDVNYAIALAWLAKAGKTAGHYMFMTGGKMFSRQQFHDHCISMYRKYAMRSPLKAARLTPQDPFPFPVPNNWNAG